MIKLLPCYKYRAACFPMLFHFHSYLLSFYFQWILIIFSSFFNLPIVKTLTSISGAFTLINSSGVESPYESPMFCQRQNEFTSDYSANSQIDLCRAGFSAIDGKDSDASSEYVFTYPQRMPLRISMAFFRLR